MFNHERVLVVAAHPDDEVLGCGATCARLARQGAEISILILGEGVTSRQPRRDPEAKRSELAGLSNATRVAGRILGARKVITENLPDNRFDSINLLDIIKKIEAVKAEVRPTLLFTHHSGDLNIDHTLTQRAVLTAFRPLPEELPIEIYSFEILSSTEYAPPSPGAAFIPDTFVEVSETLEIKTKAMAAYETERRESPHPRSEDGIICLATMRGQQVGLKRAEAFASLRRIIT